MDFQIRARLRESAKSYASHTPKRTSDILDCSLGVNPYGCPQSVIDAMKAFDWSTLPDYPHARNPVQAISRHWMGSGLKEDNLALTDGSIEALYLINQLFAVPDAQIVGFIPTFTDMLVNAHMLGIKYKSVPLSEDDMRKDIEMLLEAVTKQTVLIYVDNPNNPTGQTLPLEALEHVIKGAARHDIAVLIDEAYGGFCQTRNISSPGREGLIT